MAETSGFPYFEVQFDKHGAVHDAGEVQALLSFVDAKPVTDLIVISHGWNNNMEEARNLYHRFFQCVRAQLNNNAVPGAAGRQFAVMGVLWPSKKFADRDLIAGGAASGGSPVTDAVLREQLDDLKELADDPAATAALEQAKQLIPKLEDSPSARQQFADLVRSILPKDETNADDASDDFVTLPGAELMNRLSKPVLPAGPPPGGGGAAGVGSPAGSAAFLGQFFAGIRGAALNLLNLTTYYQMKERAGTVGRGGVYSVLRRVRQQRPDLKLHLVGHSFGGRLVTAAALGPDNQPRLDIASMTLLQAAFSHYGFADNYEGVNDGFFRSVVTAKSVKGPVLITCTPNDTSVGKAYPLASMVAGQVASALGDKNDRFGGIGRNGAQKTPEAVDGKLLAVGGAYQFQGGKLYNLNADAFIKDHGAVANNETAYAVLSAVAAT